ncbi:MAG: histidine kinase [Rhodococcus sp. (in: high G+C Gram-positive bacteria)]
MIAYPRKLRGADFAIGATSWVLAIGAVVLLPLDSSDRAITVSPIGSGAWWVLAAVLTVQAVLLPFSGTYARAVLLSVTLAPLVVATVAPSEIFSVTALAVMVAVFLSVARKSLNSLMITLPVGAAGVLLGDVVNRAAVDDAGAAALLVQSVLQTATVVGLPLLIGSVVASRREARIAHRNELGALEREHDAQVMASVAGERAAMARELHDIAAHHLSGIALMAAATGRQIDSDPDAARRSADQIRVQARSVLDDLRRLVGLMRDDGAAAERSVETLGSIEQLVNERRASGADIELRLVGARDLSSMGEHVGPLAELVAYRMVQESLTNAVRHSPGSSCVLEVDDQEQGALTIRVRNEESRSPVSASQAGFGLLGMRERAALVGGTVQYGPTENGGWTVELRLPRESTASGSKERT